MRERAPGKRALAGEDGVGHLAERDLQREAAARG